MEKYSNFGEDAFITQNLNFYRKQYEQVFKSSNPNPTNKIIRNNIDGGDVLSQQYLRRVIAESSVPAARKLHGPSRKTLVNDSWRQRNKGPYKCYLQRCPDSNSTSYQKEESTTAAPDYEIKSLWTICNSHSVLQFSSASVAEDEEEYQPTERELWLMRELPRPQLLCKPAVETVSQSRNFPQRRWLNKKSINITEKGLWLMRELSRP